MAYRSKGNRRRARAKRTAQQRERRVSAKERQKEQDADLHDIIHGYRPEELEDFLAPHIEAHGEPVHKWNGRLEFVQVGYVFEDEHTVTFQKKINTTEWRIVE